MASQDPIISIIIAFLTQPSSDFYLSKLIGGSTSPKLEPFTDASINLGTQNIEGLKMGFVLNNVNVQGLSNVMIEESGGSPKITVNGDQVTFNAAVPNTQAPPAGVPNQIILNADLAVTPQGTPAFTAQINATVNTAELIGVFSVTNGQDNGKNVVITFTNIKVNTAAIPSNIHVSVKIQSVFKGIINSVMNEPNILSKIVSEINGQLNQPSVLAALSQYGTQAARAELAKSPVG